MFLKKYFSFLVIRHRDSLLHDYPYDILDIPWVYERLMNILHAPRAQILRWFHDQAEIIFSPLYMEVDLADLLVRVSESFHGASEE